MLAPSRTLILLLAAVTLAAVDVEPAKLGTADAAPLDPGVLEIAIDTAWSSATHLHDTDGDSVDRGGRLSASGVGLGLTYGLVPGLHAGLGLGLVRVEDEATDPDQGTGLTDLELGAKWAFWSTEDGDRRVALALLPTGIAPLGRGHDDGAELPTAGRSWNAGLALAASGQIDALALNGDLGYGRALGAAAERNYQADTVSADLALGWQVSPRWQPEVEVNWVRVRPDEGTAAWSLAMTVGVQVCLPGARVALGFQQVVAGSEVDKAATALLGVAIPMDL